MRQDDLCKRDGRSVGAVPLGDRFQGALLGLSLLPTALSPISIGSNASSRHLESLLGPPLLQALDCSFAQARSFISAPNTWMVDLGRLQSPTFLLPACVPVLLRYHDSWRRRFDRLMRLPWQIDLLPVEDRSKDWDSAIAQLLMLGDLLEIINLDTSRLLSQTDGTAWLADGWLTDCAKRYQVVPQIHVRYEGLLSSLNLSALNPYIGYSTGDATQRLFLVGVMSALAHLESYVLAVQGLSGYSSIWAAALGNATQIDDQSTEAIASAWLAAFVAGLLSGALSGRSGLPALWQMCPDIDRHRALANELFSLWAGGLSAISLPD